MAILICEDNTLAARALSAVLSREGYQCETACDGIDAMAILARKEFDLVVVDIHLPYHSGLELVTFLRNKSKKKTPVIIVSAFSDPQMQRQAKELGVNDYVVKPVDMADIINRVRGYLAG
jgi:DNA-binding response OmpR family regulator